MQDLHKIAQVLKSNGTDGELILGFRDIAPEDINVEEPVFIYFDGLPVPFFIGSLRRKGQNKALVRLTGICSDEDAREVTGRSVYAETGTAGTEYDEDFSSLVGWLEIAVKDAGTSIIPLHEDLIISADEKKQELTMSIPAGLV